MPHLLLTQTDASALPWLALLGSYLLGSVPFGFVMAKVIAGKDLRQIGSGNIGATNAMRVLGKPLGLLAFLLDFGKGYAPAAWFAGGDPKWMVLCGTLAVCGHVWPIYLRFKGGKAVATGCGAICAIDPMIVLLAALGWLVTLMLTRYVALASMMMGVLFPTLAWWRSASQPYGTEMILATGALALLILVRHRSNVARMLAGTESKTRLGFGGKKELNGDG